MLTSALRLDNATYELCFSCIIEATAIRLIQKSSGVEDRQNVGLASTDSRSFLLKDFE